MGIQLAVLSYVQKEATTPNIVRPIILGVVRPVLAVVCKRIQQLPLMMGPAVHRWKYTTLETPLLRRLK